MGRTGRVVRVLLWLFGGVVAIVAVAYVVLVVRSNSMLAEQVTVPAPIAEVRIPEGDAAAIARGRYLVRTVLGCQGCHDQDFGGRAEIDDPMVGTLWGPNLTSGRGSVVRDYTAVDWIRAIRHGVGREGRRLILMPSRDFELFSDEDLGAVIAAVKAAPPVDRDNRGIQLGPLGRALIVTGQVTFAFDEIDHALVRTPVAAGPTVEHGRVLAGSCVGCHAPNYSGGPIPGAPPDWPPARNLTADPTGMKDWSLQDFVTAMRTGKRPDGVDIRPPMPWQAIGTMTDADLEAMYLFLRTVEPLPTGQR